MECTGTKHYTGSCSSLIFLILKFHMTLHFIQVPNHSVLYMLARGTSDLLRLPDSQSSVSVSGPAWSSHLGGQGSCLRWGRWGWGCGCHCHRQLGPAVDCNTSHVHYVWSPPSVPPYLMTRYCSSMVRSFSPTRRSRFFFSIRRVSWATWARNSDWGNRKWRKDNENKINQELALNQIIVQICFVLN